MRKTSVSLRTLTGAVTVFAMGFALTPAANAQQAGGAAQGNAPQANGQGRRGGGRGLGNLMNPNAPLDPTRSSELALLQRTDVRTELQIDAGQRENLDKMKETALKDASDKMTAARRDFQQQNGGQNPRNLDPAARQEYRQKMQTFMQEQTSTIVGDLDKKAESYLNARQVARLHQLDLQWRGPLALTDKNVADALKVTPDQKTKIAEIYQTFQTAQRQAFRNGNPNQGRRGNRNGNGNGNNPGGNANPNGADPNAAPPTPLTPEQMKARQEEAQKAVQKARVEATDKVVALLTPEQVNQWKAMQGRAFKFSANMEA